jgi:hypothetical protein
MRLDLPFPERDRIGRRQAVTREHFSEVLEELLERRHLVDDAPDDLDSLWIDLGQGDA